MFLSFFFFIKVHSLSNASSWMCLVRPRWGTSSTRWWLRTGASRPSPWSCSTAPSPPDQERNPHFLKNGIQIFLWHLVNGTIKICPLVPLLLPWSRITEKKTYWSTFCSEKICPQISIFVCECQNFLVLFQKNMFSLYTIQYTVHISVDEH